MNFITIIFLIFKGEQFITVRNFTRHNKEVHNEDKPYKCEVCNKTYSFEKRLNDHTCTPTVKKLYLCEFCGKLFT